MTPVHIDAAQLRTLVPMADAITSLRAAFYRPLEHSPRQQISVGRADLLVMPAVWGHFAGVKSIVVQPANAGTERPVIGGSYVLLDADLASAVATFDGAALTALRTPAVSAIAIDRLARFDIESAVIIGTGPQSLGHREALAAVRPSCSVTIVGRARSTVERAAIRRADVVITATSSAVPVLDVNDVGVDALIVAIGSYRPDRAELTSELVRRAASVWVDDRDAAREEAGDLIQATAAGWSFDAVCGDLHDLVCLSPGVGPGDGVDVAGIRVFKSVGLAVEDVVIATAAWEHLG